MKKVLVAVVVILVALVAFIASRPSQYHVERSATIEAPPDSVYARIVDFHHWNDWSPWAKLDPAMKTDYSGPDNGVGSVYHWVGDKRVGEGRMTVTEGTPGQHVRIKLEFIKPFASVADCSFDMAAQGTGTRVTWNMDGGLGFIEKGMCLMKSMDQMIGGDFEKGLAQLKTVAEATAAAATAPADSTAAAAPAN